MRALCGLLLVRLPLMPGVAWPSKSIDPAVMHGQCKSALAQRTEMSLTQILPVAALLPPESTVILTDSVPAGGDERFVDLRPRSRHPDYRRKIKHRRQCG